MKNFISLEFATNLFGVIKPEIKKRLQAVIDNPNQDTWEDAHSLIVNNKGRMTTLWNAVIKVDSSFPKSKPLDAPWTKIPTSETIIKALRLAIFEGQEYNQN